jgi:hypothetical protein
MYALMCQQIIPVRMICCTHHWHMDAPHYVCVDLSIQTTLVIDEQMHVLTCHQITPLTE